MMIYFLLCCFFFFLMIRRPPRSTRTDTLFPYTTLFRSDECTTPTCCCGERRLHGSLNVTHGWPVSNNIDSILRHRLLAGMRLKFLMRPSSARRSYSVYLVSTAMPIRSCRSGVSSGLNSVHWPRSEERRVGNECVSTCRFRGSP